jgi:hypothetical protein
MPANRRQIDDAVDVVHDGRPGVERDSGLERTLRTRKIPVVIDFDDTQHGMRFG